MAQSYVESEKDMNDEELKRELQELLDSQLEKTSEVCVENKPIVEKLEENVNENVEQSEEEPTKEFRISEIQAFLNNQVRKQHQLQVQMVEEYEHREEDEEDADNSREPQQHVILVTQNGDKIILIQNPNAENIDSELESSAAAVAAAVGAGDKDRHLISSVEYQPAIEIDEQEEYQIQMQHKFRQKMLLMQLEKLRGRKKVVDTPPAPVVCNESNDDSNFWDSVDAGDHFHEDSDCNSKSGKKSNASKRKSHGVEPEKVRVNAKWFQPLNIYLSKAYNYVKRRGDKIEQVCKFFPTSSHSFDSRCQDLKQDLLKLELNIERFQNVLNKDLDTVESKMKNFIRDFHLDSVVAEIEVEDEADFDDLPLMQPSFATEIHTSNMQLITPPTVTIIPTTQENHFSDYEDYGEHKIKDSYDVEPVKEIRDIDSPIEVGDDYESRSIPVTSSGVKPTVSVKPLRITRASGVTRAATAPKFVKASGRSKKCMTEFDNGASLAAHMKEHIVKQKPNRRELVEEDESGEFAEKDEPSDVGAGDVNGCEKNSFQLRIEGCTFQSGSEAKRPRLQKSVK